MSKNLKKYKIILIPFLLFICSYKSYYKSIYLNNHFTFPYYENNSNFSEYSTSIKAIALYIPKIMFYENSNAFYYKNNFIEEIKNENYINNKKKKENNLYEENIENQIELAKSHGLHGFAIFYYYSPYIEIFNDPLDIIFENKNLNFNYLLIWKNENLTINNKLINLQKDEYDENICAHIIDKISKYLLDERYIKINDCPILGIYKPENISNIKEMISIWRNKVIEYGIKNIFILGTLYNNNISTINNDTLIDSYVYLHSYKKIPSYLYNYKTLYPYYTLIYKNEFNISNFTIFKSSSLPFKIKNDSISLFDDYTPYKFYILNKDIVNFTINNYDKEHQFFFINSFNNFIDKDFLEKDGYASINYLSKALFNISLSKKNYNLINLIKSSLIAIQVHIFFIDLLEEIMDKINNMPVKFDLYVTTTSENNKNIIEKYVKLKTEANNYEILVVENRGRDVLPFILQMNRIYKNYKYFCHIHSKKTEFNPRYGINWRHYLYDNLLGSEEIISEILYRFESSEKMGIIFPDNHFSLLQYAYHISKNNLKFMNYLIKQIFPGYKFDTVQEFPAGDMFWGRVSAVYQIFEKLDYISSYCPKERKQKDHTIMHAIERIWIVIAQFNGYKYTTILRKT